MMDGCFPMKYSVVIFPRNGLLLSQLPLEYKFDGNNIDLIVHLGFPPDIIADSLLEFLCSVYLWVTEICYVRMYLCSMQ